MSLKFLNLKSFHPGNKNSQKKLFIAEEREKQLNKKENERAKEVLTEQEFIKNRALLSGSKLEAERSKVSFLYTLPPGAIDEKKQQQQQQQLEQQQQPKNDKDLKDFEKFPILANAPTDGVISSDIKLVHKPLGILINNVKCARCHNWGHRSGDRECPLIDSNPNEYKNLQMNDPMSNNNNYNNNNSNNNNEYDHQNNQDNRKRFRLNSSASSPKSYGRESNHYSVVEDIIDNNNNKANEEEDDNDDQVEREFLASLTKKQRKLLLRQIKLEEKQAKKKKKKREKRKYSDSSDSDSDRDRKKRRKSSSSSSSSSRKKEKKNSNHDFKEKSHN
ncbi:hypothetical protein ACTFIW_001671 [Dictyostelium discoideum]